MSTLQLLWFLIIGVLFTGFFFLEGFDFGVGMAMKTLARNKRERDQVINTIGPIWETNQVWLITAGGAMFASFPEWYASLFSGFYNILLLVLVGLIIRGVSFKFRSSSDNARERNLWEWTLCIGSFLTAFFLGMMFVDLVRGMPLDATKNVMNPTFTDYVNIYSIVGGVAVTLISYLHGLNYLRLKTDGKIRERANAQAKKLYPVLFVGLVAFAVLSFLETDFFKERMVSSLIILVAIVLFAVMAAYGTYKDKEGFSFISTGLIFVGLVAFLFNGLFPRVMIAQDSAFHLLIENASSTPYTLKVMTIVTVCLLPIVLIYVGWTYKQFNKRVSIDVLDNY
ncbi:cytochrome d ubiquinol oxidase subunit II [Vagococcus fluvialis]|jgi:cytochrome d ubiquinol oxidase subunit II|uniref:Cytochrome d ubiquinol oxidase subunit II n=1 Tax=Vagococcus fluvialis TaxID=2738 RepID=A0A369B0U7_9ENTE|nr:cytochrome d ubiquinol oxidase subunit II [Vagococcus fluvialis]MDR2276980.1 cytochrome d ubiquinol oxidase subunit II [Vagococcus sp.]OTP31176.1 cytochrome d ubiquinol oxidase, subunit II [Enterococcus sp. 6C8_DIV0013]MBO0418854.1 cytochrome d ubiquinol oxidase subunit II [Vagococcus fluvialis]MBO0428394.1 cytochrome d ubiquinol oxidase subunit II [Vagococcus fluvialis]MBO0436175.1 cytochrome d ubiquinol oxidase subunit II [Vagococcus fluvialis]